MAKIDDLNSAVAGLTTSVGEVKTLVENLRNNDLDPQIEAATNAVLAAKAELDKLTAPPAPPEPGTLEPIPGPN